jgi:hypothetical protein
MSIENGVVECSFSFGLVGGAQSTADEYKHPDEAEDPNNKCDVKVVGHGPGEGFGGSFERARAQSIILCEHEGADNTKNNELEEAGEEGAVDGADSPSVPPSSNEHEKCVETDDTVDDAHEGSDQSKLRSRFLAVDVTVLI